MSGPANFLRQIPAEFTLAAALTIGSVILVCLVLFHGTGIHWVLAFHKRGNHRLRSRRPHISAAIFLFGMSVFLLLSLHIIGIVAWAFALTHLGLISNAKDAIYFCANAYTTLGYGQVDLDPQYRIISPIMGISGLFTFAWTTSALVTIVTAHNALLETLQEERAKQKQLRYNLQQAERSAHASERQAIHEERIEYPQESAGASLLRHWQLWREERRKIKAMFRQERTTEDDLGAPPTDKPNIPPKS